MSTPELLDLAGLRNGYGEPADPDTQFKQFWRQARAPVLAEVYFRADVYDRINAHVKTDPYSRAVPIPPLPAVIMHQMLSVPIYRSSRLDLDARTWGILRFTDGRLMCLDEPRAIVVYQPPMTAFDILLLAERNLDPWKP